MTDSLLSQSQFNGIALYTVEQAAYHRLRECQMQRNITTIRQQSFKERGLQLRVLIMRFILIFTSHVYTAHLLLQFALALDNYVCPAALYWLHFHSYGRFSQLIYSSLRSDVSDGSIYFVRRGLWCLLGWRRRENRRPKLELNCRRWCLGDDRRIRGERNVRFHRKHNQRRHQDDPRCIVQETAHRRLRQQQRNPGYLTKDE